MKNQLKKKSKLFAFLSRLLQTLMILSFIDAVFIDSAILSWLDKASDSIGFIWFVAGLPGRTVSFFLTPFLGQWTLWFSIGQLFALTTLFYLHWALFTKSST